MKTLESLQRNDRLSRIGSIDTPVTGLENDTVTVGDTVADPGDPYSEILDSVTERQLKEILWDIVEDLPGERTGCDQNEIPGEFVLQRDCRQNRDHNRSGQAMGIKGTEGTEKTKQGETAQTVL